MNEWERKNRVVLLKKAAERYKENPSSTWSKERKAKIAANTKRLIRNRREIVVNHYGARCVCCGEENPGFLTIDHKNGGGIKMRKVHGVGLEFYRWIIRNDFPDFLQVLCYNCNCGRELNGGICPHHNQGRFNDYPEREYAASYWQRKRPAFKCEG